MRWTIAHTYVGSLFGALITCCGVVLFVSINFMKVPIEDELNKGIRRMQHVISAANETTSQKFLQCADLIAENDDFNKAVAEKDTEAASRLGIVLMKKAGSDFMTITDEKGMVIARGHSKKHGDSVTNQETVVMALKGSPAVAVVAGTEVPFTIRASYPVMHDGKLVGSVSIGTSLVAPAYLDWLKSISGVNVTIFKGDTRVMTTILKDDGNRAVGTKLQGPEILAAVLQRGETVFAHNNILGVDYNSAYWPVKDANNKIVGMWFVGMPIDQLQRLEKTAISNSVWIGVGLLVFQLILSLVLGLKVSAPVRKITAYAQAIAGGDTEAQLEVHSRDDMGHLADSLRTMETNLRKLVLEASEKADEARKMGEEAKAAMEDARAAQAMAEQAKREGMMSAAAQIENVVEQLNASINDIAEQVESTGGALDHAASRLAETATAMEEMNSTVLEVAKNAGGASDISNAAKHKAEVGSEIVSRAVTGIQEVQRQSQALKEGMTQLDDHAKAINQIMGVISDIADQTNLLALNAAIEAARAGEAGRGFAVVADEVRKLAEKTMTATKEVGTAIHAIQAAAKQNVGNVEETVARIEAATRLAHTSGEALREIVSLVDLTTDQVRSIATASEEQSSASEEIQRNVADINRISSETSGAMRESDQAVGELIRQVQALHRLIGQMQTARQDAALPA